MRRSATIAPDPSPLVSCHLGSFLKNLTYLSFAPNVNAYRNSMIYGRYAVSRKCDCRIIESYYIKVSPIKEATMTKTIQGRFFSLSDLSKALGLPLSTVWHRTYMQGAFPAPNAKPMPHSQRKLYTGAEFQAIVAEHGPAAKGEA